MTSNKILALFSSWLIVGSSVRAAEEFRAWTSSDGRKIEAAFVGFDNGQVRIKLRNGAVSAVALDRLSAPDQEFVKQKAAAPAPSAKETSKDQPAAEKTWLRTVSLDEPPEPEVVKEDAGAKEFVYRTAHYEFQCDSKLGTNAVKEFARIFEATYLVNCKLPLDLKPKPEQLRTCFLARLYTNKEDYFKAGAIPESAGTYLSSMKALIVPLDSLGVKMAGSRVVLQNSTDRDNATLIHEITHQMMNHWMDRLPVWYVEGSAEYVSIAKYDRGRFSFIQMDGSVRDYLQWRGGQGKKFVMMAPAALMNVDSEQWIAAMGESQSQQNYASAALLTYYFYHLDGNGDGASMIAWLREVEKAADPTAVQAATAKLLVRERTPEQLEKDVKAALRKAGIDVDFGPAADIKN
jgi:SLA1 homology domain 1, SHD1